MIMTINSDPAIIPDGELDQAQGCGVFGTPTGGWGKNGDDKRTFQTISNVMKNRTNTASDGESVASIVSGEPSV